MRPGAPRAVAGALLWNPEGTVLLQHRDDDPGIEDAGRWSLFGGGVEAGEEPRDALLRELGEELGYRPDRYRPFVVLEAGGSTFHLFLVPIAVPLSRLRLNEGQGLAYLDPEEALAGYDLSDTARTALGMLQLYRGFRAGRGSPGLID